MDLEPTNKPEEALKADEATTPVEETSAVIDQAAVEAAAAEAVEAAVETAAVAEPVVEAVSEEPQPARRIVPDSVRAKPKSSLGKNLVTWLLIALVSFLGGLATLYFALYQPYKQTTDAAAAASTEKIASLTEDLSKAEIQNALLQTNLDTTKAELETAKATITEQEAAVTAATLKRAVYKLLTDVNSARFALGQADTATTRQALTFAKDDLKELEALGLDKDSYSGFSSRLDEAASNLFEQDQATSREALNTLYGQVLLLANHLP